MNLNQNGQKTEHKKEQETQHKQGNYMKDLKIQ